MTEQMMEVHLNFSVSPHHFRKGLELFQKLKMTELIKNLKIGVGKAH
jgi:hypothetical protein